ncbi:sensor histidine kinase [Cryobacterium frigoriphilum]|uniref:Sensor histidine kinase n=1 Tax=Cryobacterium frigoriphilum TaxID=1259150 RepID=A0A4R9A9T6_9MICO|nr:sensor histidine kinase [Cryobacterium frigoriphilum]TFD54507.1 sensor histidine kinase [Cryobacterium frigoriphilum]
MTAQRWWDVAFAGTLTLMAGVALIGEATDAARAGVLLTLAGIGVFYAGFGRRGICELAPNARPGHAGAALALRLVVIIGCGVATAISPDQATLQSLVFPLLWVLAPSIRAAISWNAAFALVMVAALTIGLGGTLTVVPQAALIEGLAFVFSLALGFWITRISLAAEQQRALVATLTAAQGELAALHHAAGGASERERLAREMHDTIAQSLTSLVMLAQRTRIELAGVTGDTAAAGASVDLIESYARDALTEARTLVAAMSPVRVGDSSLGDALGRLAERFERETGIRVDATAHVTDLDRELEVVLLRCAQEGLANVRKHSRASVASVALTRTHNLVTLTVTDNGRGLRDYSAAREVGFGLAGMRDRLALVGGALEVRTGDSGGTLLRVSVPADPAEASATDAAAPVESRTR